MTWFAHARPLALALSAGLLAGCSLPPYTAPKPELDIPAHWRSPNTTPSTPPAAATAPHASAAPAPLRLPVPAQWWRAFGDPVLDRVVERVLQQNTDLRLARLRVAEYRARLDIARSAQAPAFSASMQPVLRMREQIDPERLIFADATVHQAGLEASYEVDLWGRLQSLSDAALADLQGQQYALDAAALSLAANAVMGYLNLRSLDAQLHIAQVTLATRKASLDRAKHLLDMGYNSRTEWIQFESDYLASAAAIPALERSIALQENALRLLLDENPEEIQRGLQLTQWQLPSIASGLPSELLRHRPDIAQAEERVVATDKNLAAARDQLLPSLKLSASGTWFGFTWSQLLNTPYRLWSLGGSILTPVLQGNRLRATVDVADTQRAQAILGYEKTVREAFIEVENALLSIDALQKQLTQTEAREKVSTEALRVVRNRYRNGYASYLEELDAQRTNYAAQQAVVQTRATLLTSYVDLYRALGGGWSDARASANSKPNDGATPQTQAKAPASTAQP